MSINYATSINERLILCKNAMNTIQLFVFQFEAKRSCCGGHSTIDNTIKEQNDAISETPIFFIELLSRCDAEKRRNGQQSQQNDRRNVRRSNTFQLNIQAALIVRL